MSLLQFEKLLLNTCTVIQITLTLSLLITEISIVVFKYFYKSPFNGLLFLYKVLSMVFFCIILAILIDTHSDRITGIVLTKSFAISYKKISISVTIPKVTSMQIFIYTAIPITISLAISISHLPVDPLLDPTPMGFLFICWNSAMIKHRLSLASSIHCQFNFYDELLFFH